MGIVYNCLQDSCLTGQVTEEKGRKIKCLSSKKKTEEKVYRANWRNKLPEKACHNTYIKAFNVSCVKPNTDKGCHAW